MIRIPLQNETIVLEKKAIDFYVNKFPKLDIEKELELIAHFFRIFEIKRATNKKDLAIMIETLLEKASVGKGINEQIMKKIVGVDYVDLETYKSLEKEWK